MSREDLQPKADRGPLCIQCEMSRMRIMKTAEMIDGQKIFVEYLSCPRCGSIICRQ